jgi:MoxR-like ATPase
MMTQPGHAPSEGVPVQRLPAEVVHAEELDRLERWDPHPVPPGWRLSPIAVERFIEGDAEHSVERKFVAEPGVVTRTIISLLTDRGALLVGPPGTAKSWFSELLAAAISRDSLLTAHGGAISEVSQLLYTWNDAMLAASGPSWEALVPSPLFRGMREGRIVRFEEVARCPQPLQDALLNVLSDRVIVVPELIEAGGVLHARPGFNVIATSNDVDEGLHRMSAALKRRLNFERIPPIRQMVDEIEVVRRETAKRNRASGVDVQVTEPVLEVLVTMVRELRTGQTLDGRSTDRLAGSSLSTAEAVGVAHALSVHAWYYADAQVSVTQLVHFLLGAILKDVPEDRRRLLHYFDTEVARKPGAHWAEALAQRHLLR